jgi:transposase-like protein
MSGQMANETHAVDLTTRRRWSEEDKRTILAEIAEGMSVSEVARRRGMSRDLLFRWRREERRKATGTIDAEGFVRLPPPVPQAGANGGIEIALGSGVRLIVDAATDLALLKRVIAVLGS